MAAGTSQKSRQPSTYRFLTPGTAVWAMGTVLHLGRESHVDQPSPAPFPCRPWPAFPWPGSELPAHPVWQTLHLPYFTGWGGWRHARAGLASAAAGEGRGRSLQRGLQPWGLRTGDTGHLHAESEKGGVGPVLSLGDPHTERLGVLPPPIPRPGPGALLVPALPGLTDPLCLRPGLPNTSPLTAQKLSGAFNGCRFLAPPQSC